MKVVRWGIVGCGDVCEVKSGPGFQKAEGSELVAVMRRDGSKAAEYARRHGVGRWYDDVDALINDREVDAVYVATPPGAHEEVAMKVLAAGKACYVEKPMARNASEARRMVEGFKGKGVPLFVAYYRRALPRFLKVREILRSGVLGRIDMVGYRYLSGQMRERDKAMPWRLSAEQSGGGLFMDLGSHVLDLLDYFFGEVKFRFGTVTNEARAYEVEDTVRMNMTIWGVQSAFAEWRFSEANERDDLFLFVGWRGATLAFSCFGNEPIVLRDGEGRRMETFEVAHPAHVHQPLIQTIVDELRGMGRCESTGESGLRTQEVMDAVLEGYYGGREDGFWGREWPGARG